MSDEQQSNVNSQQEEEEDEQNSEQQEEDDDQDEDQDQDQDDEDGSGDDEDQDEDGSGDDDDQQQQDSGNGDQQQQKQEQQEENKKLPTFKMVTREQPEQFKYTSLLSQISNLSCSVDNFIGTLHTAAQSGVSRRPYSNNYVTQDKFYQTRLEDIKVPESQVSRVVIMKDNDAQVDMKPQIIIQPTKPIKEEPVIQAKPYKISTQSEKFLSQLYQENKKLKRWQVNPTHPMNSYMTSFANSNGFSNSSKGFYNSKDKFERKQYEKGIFNVDQRNKQIDEAIMMLKREEQDQY